ncbi:MAG TPA: KpsF/GutQ family sugar-phosphate isomerase [Candidatus Marinimicrobia bacterium]|nr:KpsF/GutQ family sugar-phosphate isomerase [Candidatus Neomarinimicrobiota bacterium]
MPKNKSTSEKYLEKARELLRSEAEAIATLPDKVDQNFKEVVEVLFNTKGKVIVTGVGKSGHIGCKIAATFASTGTPSFFMHAYEAGHGDLGVISPDDTLLIISNSGETDEIIQLIPPLKKMCIPIIGLLGRNESTLAKKCDYVISTQINGEADPLQLVPTTSAIATLAMGDALAISLLAKRHFNRRDFAGLHPSGSLGRRLLTTVADLMHTGEEIPFVKSSDKMPEVLYMMTKKSLGIVGVLDDSENLIGVVTDGDLRRGLERQKDFMEQTAIKVMSHNPKWIKKSSLAIEALHLMEEHSITNLFVYNGEQNRKPIGIIHIHDILRYGIMP